MKATYPWFLTDKLPNRVHVPGKTCSQQGQCVGLVRQRRRRSQAKSLAHVGRLEPASALPKGYFA